jgi:hypothetical protein
MNEAKKWMVELFQFISLSLTFMLSFYLSYLIVLRIEMFWIKSLQECR